MSVLIFRNLNRADIREEAGDVPEAPKRISECDQSRLVRCVQRIQLKVHMSVIPVVVLVQ